MKEKVIIFGCGKIGEKAYIKLKDIYEIIAWCDNNPSLWGTEKEQIPIFSISEIKKMEEEYSICVAMEDTNQVLTQLKSNDIEKVFVWKKGFFYSVNGLMPLEIMLDPYKKKTNDNYLDVLFIADSSNIRDHKEARAVSKLGHRVHLAYICDNSEITFPEFASMYCNIYPIYSINGLRKFIEESEFDIIHCSSEPDYIAPLLRNLDKVIILDCHDLRSETQSMTIEEITVEFLAHKGADGVIYPTNALRENAVRKFGLNIEKTLVLENYISENLIPTKRLEKISAIDGKIHCVYEGGILDKDTFNKRYMEKIWLKMAKAGIHVHFYTAYNEKYCAKLDSLHENIHYEGNCSSRDLAYEMSKYDIGLVVYNVNKKNKLYLECASPNKMFEYVNAGLPVAVYKIDNLIKFAEEHQIGKAIDIDENLYQTMLQIKKIEIEDDYLKKHKMIMEEQGEKIVNFYNGCRRKK